MAINLPIRTWGAIPLPSSTGSANTGGFKHHRYAWNPIDKRIYHMGGDGGGEVGGSAIQDMWSLDLDANFNNPPDAGWRKEQDYCPTTGIFVERPDEHVWVFDTNRNVFWFLSGGQPFSNPCGTAATALKNVGVYWDYDLNTSTSITRWVAPAGDAVIDNKGVTSPTLQGIYDPPSDKIYRFTWHGAMGMALLLFDCANAVANGSSVSQTIHEAAFDGNNHRLNELWHLYDPDNRNIYFYVGTGKCLRFSIPDYEASGNAKTSWTIVKSDLPHMNDFAPGIPTADADAVIKGVWDNVSKVCIWVLKSGFQHPFVDMWTYKPSADLWEQQAITPPSGHTAMYGNSIFHDEGNNVLWISGNVNFDNDPNATHAFIWRYQDAVEGMAIGGVAQPATGSASLAVEAPPVGVDVTGQSQSATASASVAVELTSDEINVTAQAQPATSSTSVSALSPTHVGVLRPQLSGGNQVFDAALYEAGAGATFDASVTGTGTVAADLLTTITLASSLSETSSIQADLATQIAMDSAVSAQGTTQADLTTAIELAASRTASGTVAADLTTQIQMATVVSASGTVTANLKTAVWLAASVNASGNVTAELAGGSALFAASVAATGTASADLDISISLGAEVSASGAISSDLTTQITFATTVSGSVASFADLDTQITFAGSLTASGSTTAQLAGTGALFAASVTGAITVSGDLLTQILMQSGLSTSGSVSASLTVGAVVINTGAKETLVLTAENPTLTLS